MKYPVTVLRFVRGYVFFKAEKGFIERFLNLCSKSKINIWDITKNNSTMTAYISVKDFKKIRPIAKKSGVKISIIKKNGLIFQYKKYNKRIGLAIGIVIFIAVQIFLNQFVWCMDVTGNKSLSKEEIIKQLELQGLTFGTYIDGFDEVKSARKIITLYTDKILWLSINIRGSMAIIELRENGQNLTEAENKTPCNIVADFDGIILSVDTFRGDAEVNEGNGVKKGDMLINGVIVNEDLSTTYYKAKGKITALRNNTVIINEKTVNFPCGLYTEESYIKIGLFGLEIPLGRYKAKSDEIIFEDKRCINLNGFNLPFYIIKNTIVKRAENRTLDKGTYSSSHEKINYEIYNKNRNSTIVTKSEAIYSKNGVMKYSGEYTLIDFMGEEKPILSDTSK